MFKSLLNSRPGGGLALKARLLHIWEILISSYWFIPTVMLLVAVGLAVVLLQVDARYIGQKISPSYLYAGGADGARSVLATVAASIITVAGVVFSITIATLSQASSQFGPRLLRNFMRDTGNQVVLGTFVATFVYCVIILRSIGGDSEQASVPHASVTCAVLLSLSSIAVLIYFIHHVSLSLQAPIVAATVVDDLEQALDSVFPRKLGHGPHGPRVETDAPQMPPKFDAEAVYVASPEDGYIQVIDQETLMSLAVEHDLLIKLEQRPGDYSVKGNPLMHAWPPQRCTPQLLDQLRTLFIIGRQRTAEQDVEFAINQLVEVAVRALSPATNDPYTAINCIDRLSSVLVAIEHADLHGSYRYDAAGRLRAIVRVSTFSGFVDAAFNHIRQYSQGHVGVIMRLLEAITAIAHQVQYDEHRRDLIRHAEMIHRQAHQSVKEPNDLADIEERFETAIAALTPAPPVVKTGAPAALISPGERR